MPNPSWVIAETRSDTALRVAYTNPALRIEVANNEHLSEELWTELFKPKTAAKIAVALASRPLSPAQLDRLIEIETRSSVLTAALTGGTVPTAEQALRLLDHKACTKDVALAIRDACQSTDALDVTWFRAAAAKTGGRLRIEFWLAHPGEFTDAEIGADLQNYSSWGHPFDKNDSWKYLLAERPGVLPWAVLTDSDKFRTSVAGCLHLTDPQMQRQVADLDEAGRIIGSTTSSFALTPEQRTFIDNHVWTWLALANNPACDLQVVKDIDRFLRLCTDASKSYSASDRLSRRPYRLAGPLAEEQDQRLLDWVASRTLPTEYNDRFNVRPWDLPALLRVPTLPEDLVTKALEKFSRHPVTLAYRGVKDAFLTMLETYPALAHANGWTSDSAHTLASEFSQYVTEHRQQPDSPQPWSFADEQIEACATQTAYGHYGQSEQARRTAYLDRHMPDKPVAWQMLFGLLDTSFTGTLADMVMVCSVSS